VAAVRRQRNSDLAKLEIEQPPAATPCGLRADVRDLEQLMAAVDRMKGGARAASTGLVPAAGVLGPVGPLLSNRPKEWAETLDINLLGVVNSVRAVLPRLVRSAPARSSSSSAAAPAIPGLISRSHAATKAAVTRFRRGAWRGSPAATTSDQLRGARAGPTPHMTDEILRAGEENAGANESPKPARCASMAARPRKNKSPLSRF